MNSSRRSILSRLDDAVRWTGIPARVDEALSGDPSVDRKHQPQRWAPLVVIAVAIFPLAVCLILPPIVDRFSLATAISMLPGMMISIAVGVVAIHTHGPLGKASRVDDEREAALRKDSFLFCFGLLAALNALGQPCLLILSRWQNWSTVHGAVVVSCALILNAALLGTLPTLYASWRYRRLPKE